MDFEKIAYEINTQDNRITQDPLFCVFQKHQIYGVEPDCHDIEFEVDEEGNEHSYIEVDEFVNAHFTEKSAEYHIKINGHNLRKPFIYVTSLYRCPEMIAIRNALANKPLHPDASHR